MARPSRKVLLVAIVIECALVLAGAEAAVRALDLDGKLLRPLLYYQMNDRGAHRASADVARHYELAPGTRTTAFAPRRPREIGVNSLGFRGLERSAEKPRGTFRVVCFGGSNTYGALVGDDETWPAYLEKRLNAGAGKTRFEVWNAGISAYTLSQNVAEARSIAARYQPDLLIFQVSNRGPRAFLPGQDFRPYFEADPSLFAENLPFPRDPSALHTSLMVHWRFYRALNLLANRFSDRRGQEVPITAQNDWHNYQAFFDFARSPGRPPFVLLAHPGSSLPPVLLNAGAPPPPSLELRRRLPKGAGKEYLEIHPPARVYAWYASELAAFLRRERLVPAR